MLDCASPRGRPEHRSWRSRACAQNGTTLVEMLVVLAILTIVMAPLVVSFTTSIAHEARIARDEVAYSNARTAIQRMKLDVRCANAITGVEENAYGGFTLTLTESNDAEAGWCPGVIPAGSSSVGVQWCTIPDATDPTSFGLYRFLGVGATICDGALPSTFQVGYVRAPASGWPSNASVSPVPADFAGNLWPDAVACTTNRLPTLAVDMTVALDPVRYPSDRYRLRNQLNLRNAQRCP